MVHQFTVRHNKYALATILLLLGSLHLAQAESAAVDIEGRRRYQPTVSRAEAELLAEAQNVAATNLTAAAELLADSVEQDSSAAIDYALGNFLFQEDKLERAAQAYRAAIEKMPLFQSALGNLGRIHLLRERPDEALAIFGRLVENDLASSDTYSLLAQAHLLRENYVSAENAFRRILLLQPDDTNARMGLAKCLLQQERLEEARGLTAELLKGNPDDSELWSLHSNIALAMNSMPAALIAIESARRIGAANANMLLTLGDIYLNRNQPKEALAAYEAAFEMEMPGFDRLLRMARALLAVGAPQKAEEILARAENSSAVKQSDKGQLELLKIRAAIQLEEGNLEQARSSYRRALEIDPLDGATLLALAKVLWQQGDREQAILHCERAARIAGSAADALLLHAQIEVDRDRYARAAELLERAQAFEERKHVERYLEQVRNLAEVYE